MINILKQSNLSVAQKGAILVMVHLFSLVFLAVLNLLLDQAEHEREREAHSRAVISLTSNLRRSLFDAVSTLTEYGVTREPFFEERYKSIIAQFPRLFSEGKQLVQNDWQQRKILDHLQYLQNTATKIMEETKQSVDSKESSAGLLHITGLRKQLESLIKEYNLETTQLEASEHVSARAHVPSALWRTGVKQALWAGIILNIITSAFLAKFFSTGITRRLAVLRDNATRLAGGKQLSPPLEGKDEIAEVDNVFHYMADILATAEKKERAIIENAVDVICSIDAGLRFTAVSPAARTVWGYDPEELIGRRFIDLVVADDAKSTIDATTQLMERKAPLAFENRIKRKDGLKKSMLWSAFWSEPDRSLFCVVHDITERKIAEDLLKESEARVRLIIETMPVGLLVVDEQGVIEMANSEAAQMFAYPPGLLIYNHAAVLFPHLLKTAGKTSVENPYKTLLGRRTETYAERRNKEEFPVELSAAEFRLQEGMRLLISAWDVTERHETEKLKSELVAMASHDLRNPLSSLQGTLQMLAEGNYGVLSALGISTVSDASEEVDRLVELIDDLLDVKKIEAGKLELELNCVQPANVVPRSIRAISRLAEQNEITIKELGTSAQVYADGARLIQVLVNLLSNAIKFSPRGSTIVVSVQTYPEWVEVAVTDQGQGIPELYREKIFERFEQVSQSGATKRKGSGLGLAICKTIIEKHHGIIGVDSKEGKGSRFYFRIPVIETPE